jgi:predicted histidine transporter YuiF (NhaC family)
MTVVTMGGDDGNGVFMMVVVGVMITVGVDSDDGVSRNNEY